MPEYIEREAIIYKNRVYKSCPLFDDVDACKKVRKDCNCYQCVITRAKILEKDNERLRNELFTVREMKRMIKKILDME